MASNKLSDRVKHFKENVLPNLDDRYDYSLFEYTGYQDKSTVVCKEHDVKFESSVYYINKSKNVCPECIRESINNKNRRIRESRKSELTNSVKGRVDEVINNLEGDYKAVSYPEYLTVGKVSVFCNTHNRETPIGASALLNAYKRDGSKYIVCEECRFYKKGIEFKEECEDKFGDDIDLSEFEYKGAYEKSTIYCNRCREYSTAAPNSLRYSVFGCSVCAAYADSIYSEDIESTLYHVRFFHSNGDYAFDKIGITKNSWEERFILARGLGYQVELIRECKDSRKNCIILEQMILQSLERSNRRYKCHDLKGTRVAGWTECFYR